MYKRIKRTKLGRKKSNRNALMRNQLRSLFTTGHIVTTGVKAKVLKVNVEKLMGKIKRSSNSLVLVRDLTTDLGIRNLVESAVKYSKDAKGYVRVIKVGYRDGDNAQVSKVELVGYEPIKKPGKAKKKKATKAKETKPTVSTTKEPEVHAKKAKPKTLGTTIKEAFTGRQERARSRSGI